MAKCPACGFESPDGSLCCDFCKEPFRRDRPVPAPKKPAEPRKEIPEEFLRLDSGGSIPRVPPWLKYAAWTVLAAWFVIIMTLIGIYLAKQNGGQQAGMAGRPVQAP
ncbi:MAG: hypothetical protein HY926_08340 [Elusimicrobia bacterium]|nr:hypothetical protein [Elusimicrobiota bacterium]